MRDSGAEEGGEVTNGTHRERRESIDRSSRAGRDRDSSIGNNDSPGWGERFKENERSRDRSIVNDDRPSRSQQSD